MDHLYWIPICFVLFGCMFVSGYGLAAVFKPLRKIYCKIGWHSHTYDGQYFDGCSAHVRCQWCGYEGKVDSQGNLF